MALLAIAAGLTTRNGSTHTAAERDPARGTYYNVPRAADTAIHVMAVYDQGFYAWAPPTTLADTARIIAGSEQMCGTKKPCMAAFWASPADAPTIAPLPPESHAQAIAKLRYTRRTDGVHGIVCSDYTANRCTNP